MAAYYRRLKKLFYHHKGVFYVCHLTAIFEALDAIEEELKVVNSAERETLIQTLLSLRITMDQCPAGSNSRSGLTNSKAVSS